MKSSVLLTVAILVSMKPLFYTTSNSIMFMHTQPEVTVEGQFLASLTPLPSERARCACPSGSRASLDATRATPPGSSYSGAIETLVADWESDEKHGGQFWRVMLHDDDVHTLDYAIETVDKVLSNEGVRISPGRRRVAVQWAAYQAHHYGRGTVAILPGPQAHRVTQGLGEMGLGSSTVAD